jgi:class 3 adenylate cyclase
LRVRVDRPRCFGAGSCIFVAPTVFGWHEGEHGKVAILDPSSAEEDLIREAAISCPTQAIIVEEVDEILPVYAGLAPAQASRRVERTFMFTDIARSTALVEALGDAAWESLIGWHDRTLRSLFDAHGAEEIQHRGDGFFVAFPDPHSALDCAVVIQKQLAEHRKSQGFAPEVRIGVHASTATQLKGAFLGMGIHEAARIGALGEGGEIVASLTTTEGSSYRVSEPRTVAVKGISEPLEVVTVEWG